MALTDQCVAAYRMDEIPGADRADLTGRGNALASIFPGASNTKALNIMDGGAGGHWVAGAFTKLGIWRRVITADEITSLDSMGPDAYYPWNPDQSPIYRLASMKRRKRRLTSH